MEIEFRARQIMGGRTRGRVWLKLRLEKHAPFLEPARSREGGRIIEQSAHCTPLEMRAVE